MGENTIEKSQQEDLLIRVGHMTRLLHDSLRGLGLDKLLERAAEGIPDARDRLEYVAKMSERAAQRVLNATDAAIPLQDATDDGAKNIALALQTLRDKSASIEEYQALADQTLIYLNNTKSNCKQTKCHLIEIMMAQDFQDLTGQVIKKVTELVQNIEQQLVQLLVEYSPEQVKRSNDDGLLNGPQVDPNGKLDVVANQGQVDDLLESLGF